MNQATLSQGEEAIETANVMMDEVVGMFTNFATFMTITRPGAPGVHTRKLQFSEWTNAQLDRYAYVCWDDDLTATTTVPATASFGYALNAAGYSGTILIYDAVDSYRCAAFICGAIASIDFEETNGRTNICFRSQTGITSPITETIQYDNLLANHYNVYAYFATANDSFRFFSDGKVTGPFVWVDSYVDQIWLNNAFQLALMTLLTELKAIPYNDMGYNLIRAAMMDPINAGLNFGAFRQGVPLSSLQAAEVNQEAGMEIAPTLSTQGWFLKIWPATAQIRAARLSPQIKFWYMDGQSVQRLDLNSIEVM
jgi:hypothetical protein